jgi:signal transduction histidine kinase
VHPLRYVGLQETAPEIVRAAVEAARTRVGTDASFAAVITDDGYAMAHLEELTSPGWRHMRIRPLRGLGGKVLVERAPCAVGDYLNDTSITADFRGVVADEGLRGVACAPINGPDGICALLYAGVRRLGLPGDMTVEALRDIAGRASIGIHHVEARAIERELEALRERRRLAMELHDAVAQPLFSIGVAAGRVRGVRDERRLAEAIEEIEAAAAEARRELRAALGRTETRAGAERVAFDAALLGELSVFRQTTGCQVHMTRAGDSRPLPEDVERLILGVVREGLRNAVKHLAARLAVVHLSYGPTGVTVSVQAQPERAPAEAEPFGTGVGLALLRSRAEALRGSLHLTVEEDGVSLLRLQVPAHDLFAAPV